MSSTTDLSVDVWPLRPHGGCVADLSVAASR
jgi:hypothetical protein